MMVSIAAANVFHPLVNMGFLKPKVQSEHKISHKNKPCYFPLSPDCFLTDPYNGRLESLYKWVV